MHVHFHVWHFSNSDKLKWYRGKASEQTRKSRFLCKVLNQVCMYIYQRRIRWKFKMVNLEVHSEKINAYIPVILDRVILFKFEPANPATWEPKLWPTIWIWSDKIPWATRNSINLATFTPTKRVFFAASLYHGAWASFPQSTMIRLTGGALLFLRNTIIQTKVQK